MDLMNSTQRIKEKARQLGFELVGIAPATPTPDYTHFLRWLDQGHAGTMAYLQRGTGKRGNLELILPGVRSIICCALNYYTGDSLTPNPSPDIIARYAWGEDYHEVMGKKMQQLETFIHQEIDPTAATKSYVDTGPILERAHAAQAGLGWIGKNSCLINNGLGSYIFLGEILTTLELDHDRPTYDQCGTCTKCLDSCPTGALVAPYQLDSRKCISYLTIEYRGDFDATQSKMVGDHLYGCDICQEVCPYNDRIPVTPLPEFQPRPALLQAKKVASESEFKELIKGSAMDRIKFSQWVRNQEALKKS